MSINRYINLRVIWKKSKFANLTMKFHFSPIQLKKIYIGNLIIPKQSRIWGSENFNGLLMKWKLLCVHATSLQWCLTLCYPMDCGLPGSSVQGVLQAIIMEWVFITYSRYLPDPGIKPASLAYLAMGNGFFTTNTTWEVPINYCSYF